ncbi:hypothetical protein NSQ26_09170 [Bacillus sp. FSL W7-1360]
MSKNEDRVYVDTRVNELNDEQRQIFWKVEKEVYAQVSSQKKVDMILRYMINDWLVAKKGQCIVHENSASLQRYCTTFISDLRKKMSLFKVVQVARIGALVLSVAFALQMFIHSFGFFVSSIEATRFSLFPFLLLSLFGFLGIYLVQRSALQKHIRMWKVAGYISQACAIILFFAGMKWWDNILTFKLTFVSSAVFLVLATMCYMILSRWQQKLEHETQEKQPLEVTMAQKS